MVPQSQVTTKRKAAEDVFGAVKKSKKETKPKSGKRKLINGEEQPGGLVIVRGAPAPRAVIVRPPAEPAEVEEDVRQMDTETEDLRRRSRAHSSGLASSPLKPEFKFPPSSSSKPSKPSRQAPQPKRVDMLKPLPTLAQDSPHIEKNRQLRGEAPNHSRRRSSISSRGKRISSSYQTTGVISQPHNSVSDLSFHKHIDCELPEPARLRQLLIWCSSRAMSKTPETPRASSSKQPPADTVPDKELPPLSAEDAQFLKTTQEDVVRMLAEQRIPLSCYGGSLGEPPPKVVKENEQNVKNRQRDILFSAHIQRAKAEEDAWIETERFYDARIAELKKIGEIGIPSSKSKGKQRAASEDPQDYYPIDHELPEDIRKEVALAREILSEPLDDDPSRSQLQDAYFEIDELHSAVQTAVQTTRVAEIDINQRFTIISHTLAARSQIILPSAINSSPSTLSNYVPSCPDRTTDPQDIFRALSRTDAARPPAQVGDAVRRAARDMKRVTNAAGGGSIPERRLTGVPPPTPRKPPGTPRRATSPGR